MASFKKPEFPALLKSGEWQKHKGVIAKISKETNVTGLGKALDAIEAAYGKVGWDAFDIAVRMPQGKAATLEALDKVHKAAVAEFKNLDVLDSLSREVERLAPTVAAKFKANPLVPKSSVEYVVKVGDAAKKFSFAVARGTISDQVIALVADYKEAMQKAADKRKETLSIFTKALDTVINGIESQKTKSAMIAFWGKDIRNVGTQFPNAVMVYPELKGKYADWKKENDQKNMPKEDKDVAAYAKKIKKLAQEVKDMAK